MMNTLYLRKLQIYQEENLTDCRKSKIEIHCEKLQIWDHPSKVPTSRDFKRSKGLSVPSKVQVLHSHQINHIRQDGTIFQIFEKCFPNQFLHAKRREATVFGITHWIPNNIKTSLHKARANLQWSKRWSTISHHSNTSNTNWLGAYHS